MKKSGVLLLLLLLFVASSCSFGSSSDEKSASSSTTVSVAGAKTGFCTAAADVIAGMSQDGVSFKDMLKVYKTGSLENLHAGVLGFERVYSSAEAYAPFDQFASFIVERAVVDEESKGKQILEPSVLVTNMAQQMDQFVADGGCK